MGIKDGSLIYIGSRPRLLHQLRITHSNRVREIFSELGEGNTLRRGNTRSGLDAGLTNSHHKNV
jgi:hypothetical protein